MSYVYKLWPLLPMSELFTTPYNGIRTENFGQPIYYPKRKKLKGWQKENRRCTFNKHR